MVLDHSTFDFWYLVPYMSDNFYVAAPDWFITFSDLCETWWYSDLRVALRICVIFIFFTVSGICTSFSRNNFLRGIKLMLASSALSLFTVAADNLYDLGISIIFGVLHCFTVAILLYTLIYVLLKDKAKYACLGIGILMFIWGLTFDFYQMDASNDLTFRAIGFSDYLKIMIGTKFYGADCFGIMPWAGIFLIGAYGGAQVYKHKTPYLPVFGKRGFAPVRFVGRKAVWFYLLHQPIILIVVYFICLSCGIKLF